MKQHLETTYFGHLVHCTLLLLFPPCSCMLAAAGTTYCQDHCAAWIGGQNLVSPEVRRYCFVAAKMETTLLTPYVASKLKLLRVVEGSKVP